ncbi:glycosyltransferase family 2 protein [Pedobacter nototheniae]|uniref:glycosyltransferase family 2 protein n=1 Tax=Pedobacter nototheniae TaxID=2488994 RepID=UPI00103D99E4|nr:glycosyltransferase [Pedobacter nototheniae]
MTDTPEILLTVLMPVHNGEKYLKETINSILNQTLTKFEFLIINDGSIDRSEEIINSFTDPRITYIKNEQNKGIVATLNIGLELSRGKYIARIDADDIALPTRLEKQMDYMQSNPSCKMCGSQAIAINENGEKMYKLRRPFFSEEIKVNHLFRNSFIHPSVMFDSKIAKEFKYDIEYQYAEDYYLFSQIALNYEVANLNENLLLYRIHAENITSKKRVEMNQSEMKTINYLLSNLFGEKVPEANILIHHSFLTRNFDNIDMHKIEMHLLKIKNSNQKKQSYNNTLLEIMLQKEWFNFLFFSKEKNQLSKFIKSELFSIKHFNFRQFIKLATKKQSRSNTETIL